MEREVAAGTLGFQSWSKSYRSSVWPIPISGGALGVLLNTHHLIKLIRLFHKYLSASLLTSLSTLSAKDRVVNKIDQVQNFMTLLF